MPLAKANAGIILRLQGRHQAPQLVIEQRLANPVAFADVSPDRALKVLVVRG